MNDAIAAQKLVLLPSRADDNPLIQMVQLNGLIVDIRFAPWRLQEIAFHQGLISYILVDRRQGE